MDRVLNLLILKQCMLTFTGDVQLENLILKESALVSLFVQFACVARSWSVSLRNLHVHVICSGHNSCVCGRVTPFVGESNKK